QPAGYGSGAPTNNILGGITIGANVASIDNNFGEVTASLSGHVYFDRNSNGVLDVTDTPIVNVQFQLTGTNGAGTVLSGVTATSDVNGDFTFSNLLAPNASGYILTEAQPAAYRDGQMTAGTAGGTLNPANFRITGILFAGGATVTGYNFAELGTAIGGTVYRDANRDGVKQAGEVGL